MLCGMTVFYTTVLEPRRRYRSTVFDPLQSLKSRWFTTAMQRAGQHGYEMLHVKMCNWPVRRGRSSTNHQQFE